MTVKKPEDLSYNNSSTNDGSSCANNNTGKEITIVDLRAKSIVIEDNYLNNN